jgi:anti-sigma factor ChrR (cupin superfamily)
MIEFDDLELVMARAVTTTEAPRPEVKERLMARIREDAAAESQQMRPTATDRSADVTVAPELPAGFSFTYADDDWHPHPVPGIMMKLLALNRERGYATLLLDVAPGVVFPGHHHSGPEECYVVSGMVKACGRTMGPGDFHHADSETDHGELYTETGCRVIMVVAPEDYLPASAM